MKCVGNSNGHNPMVGEEPTTEYQLGVATGVWNLQFWLFLLFKTNLIGVSFPNIYYLHSIFVSNIVGKLL